MVGRPTAMYQLGLMFQLRNSLEKAKLCFSQSGLPAAQMALAVRSFRALIHTDFCRSFL